MNVLRQDLVPLAIVAIAVWLWRLLGPMHRVRWHRRATWLRAGVLRRAERDAHRQRRALDHELRIFLRRVAPGLHPLKPRQRPKL
jgi:hypothetical protein